MSLHRDTESPAATKVVVVFLMHSLHKQALAFESEPPTGQCQWNHSDKKKILNKYNMASGGGEAR